MSRFFDDLEAQLHAAARREVAGAAPGPSDAGAARGAVGPARGSRWGWLATGLRAAPVALAVLLTVGVVAAALLLLHGGGHGGIGPGPAGGGGASGGPSSGVAAVITPQIRREMGYINRADEQVMGRPACQAPNGPITPRVIHGRPGARLLGLLGVLRRPPDAQDRVGQLTNVGGVDPYAGYTRFGRDVGGHRLYVLAGRSDPAEVQPPVRCFAEERTALVRLLPSIPAPLRAPTVRLQSRLLSFVHGMLRPQDVVCLVDHSGGGDSTSCGYAAAQIAGGVGGSFTTEGPGASGGVDITIVPDGVATVSVHWPASPGRRAASATGTVVNNIAAVRVPGYRSGGSATVPMASVVVWRSRSGRVIRRWTAPAGGAGGACRKDPIPCIALLAGTSSSSGGSSSGGPVGPSGSGGSGGSGSSSSSGGPVPAPAPGVASSSSSASTSAAPATTSASHP